MRPIKLNEKEQKGAKNKILSMLERVSLDVYLKKGEPEALIPMLEDYQRSVGNFLESFARKNREKILQHFSRLDISGLFTEECWEYLGDEEKKALKKRVPSKLVSKTGFVPAGSLAELLPSSKLEAIAENILDALINMREYTAFLLLTNVDIPSSLKDVDKTFSLVRATDDLMLNYKAVKEWEEFKWEGNKTYLSVKQTGFVGGLLETLTVHSILSKLKSFLGLGIIQNIFEMHKTSFGYFADPKRATPVNLGIFEGSKAGVVVFKRPHKLSESFTNLVRNLSLTEEATKPLHDLQRARSQQEYLEDKFDRRLIKVLGADDPFAERIRTASEWYLESLCVDNQTFKLIQMTIAIEALLGDPKREEQVTERLADRCSFLLGRNQQERNDIRNDFRKIYDIRSSAIHTGRVMLSDEEHPYLGKLKKILEDAIKKEIEHHSNIAEGE